MSRRAKLAGVAVGIAIAATSVAVFADLPFGPDGTTIQACYSSGGALKVTTPAEPTCPRGYVPISWNVTGPQGEGGPMGPQGPQGSDGPPGPAGVSQVYFAQNRHVVESTDVPQEIVGLSDLPGGHDVFYSTIGNSAYTDPSGDTYWAEMHCVIKLNGADVHITRSAGEISVPIFDNRTEVIPLTVPDGSSFIVSCTLAPNQEQATLGLGRVTAMPVGAIN